MPKLMNYSVVLFCFCYYLNHSLQDSLEQSFCKYVLTINSCSLQFAPIGVTLSTAFLVTLIILKQLKETQLVVKSPPHIFLK